MATMQSTRPSQQVPQRPAPRPRRRRARLWMRLWHKRWFKGLVLAVAAFAIWLIFSVGSYLTAPGGDSVAARLAEWGRDHGLAPVIVALERLQYDAHPPKVGGTPPPIAAPKVAGVHGPSATTHSATTHAPIQIAMRPRMKSIVQPALPNEGEWSTLVTVKGQPAVQAAYMRPDSTHTSYLAGVAWMSHSLLKFNLHPGTDQPGGTWSVPTWIPPGQRKGLVATWNGAFKLADARGGFYLDGRTAGKLVDGAASEVFYKDGSMNIGTWNHEVKMTSTVVGVRQNLGLLIDNGKIAANIDSNTEFNWGATLGGKYYIFRSGVGITKQGDLVYVSGDALSAGSLALLLQRAGAVRAMELDINPAWVSYMSYDASHSASNPKPIPLLNDYQRPADRYYTPTSRDFVSVYSR